MVKLPLACKMAQAADVEIDAASRNTSEFRLPPRRILVVDDNEDTVQSMATLLELSGNRVECARDGLAALEAIDRFGPQIVLLDIGLPKMNGYQVCRAIRNNRSIDQPVVVALTGWGHCDDSSQAGFDHHLLKPVSFPALLELIVERTWPNRTLSDFNSTFASVTAPTPRYAPRSRFRSWQFLFGLRAKSP